MKKILILTLLYYTSQVGFSQITSLAWSFKASGKIQATPSSTDDIIFIGDSNGIFYAIDATNGKTKWKFQAKEGIKGKALTTDKLVFFESGNTFYALDQITGKQLWNFDTGDTLYHDQIDIYDDTRSRAISFNNMIYVGTSDGYIYGLNEKNGNVEFQFRTDDASPVRSSPLIKENKIYFGDWNGIVYCYDLRKNQLIWKKETYTFPKPYGTFGGITSAFTTYNNKLFFGSRNPIFNVLNTETGEREWSYTSPEGGWMFSTPVCYDSIIYIGGSDNHSLFAFDPVYGLLKWKYNSGQNIMSEPLVNNTAVIFTTGDVYNPNSPGAIIRIDRKSGELISKMLLPKLSISSPIEVDDKIVIGCYDGSIYSLDFYEKME